MSDPFAKFKSQLRENKRSQPLIEESTEEETVYEEITEDLLPPVEPPKFDENTPIEQKMEYVFFPKQDITTYDLARILSFAQMMISPDIYEKIPEELQKHFTHFEDVNNNAPAE